MHGPVRPELLTDPVQHLLALVGQSPARRLVVGLVGLPGSGKSTLAALLCEQVNRLAGPDAMVALGMDGFHLTRAALAVGPDPAAALMRRGAPWTFDPAALARRILDLRDAPTRAGAAAKIRWPGFSHGVGDPVPDAVTVSPSVRLVLVEGLYLLHRDDGWNLAGLLDECWYLDVGLDVALEQLAKRHMAAWGLTRQQALARIAANDALNARTVLQGRDRADWLVAREPQ